MKVQIRRETPKDYEAIYHLVQEAFATASHSDGDEQDLVTRLRESEAYIPELALVAELDGNLVGYSMMTTVQVGEQEAVALGPLAVLPQAQGKGIGGALLKEGHRIAKELGYGFCILVGHETYYPRFGYRKASSFGIQTKLDVPDENFMAYPLQEGLTRLEGTIVYSKAWGLA